MPENFDVFSNEKIFSDDNIYAKKVVEELLEEDEFSPQEEGFMVG